MSLGPLNPFLRQQTHILPPAWGSNRESTLPREGAGQSFWKQVVLGEECPRDDAHVHPDTKEVTEAAILSLGGTDLLPRPVLNFLGHHVELVNGGDVPLTLGLWLLKHRVVGGSNRRDGWPRTGLKPVARREKWLVGIFKYVLAMNQ